MILPIQDGRD